MRKIYIIAGEASGDFLGAHILRALKKEKNIILRGIGGTFMKETGFSSLFPMEELSIMGLFEVLPKILSIRRRLHETLEDIRQFNPDILFTIDSPGFCLRVAKKVTCHKIHYVAPSVWAWRPGRAKKLPKVIDHLLTLFDFEPPYFTPYGLKTTFVGHPLIEEPKQARQKNILLLPGSRVGEVQKHWPIFLETAQQLLRKDPSLSFVVYTLPHLENLLMYDKNLPITVCTTKKNLCARAALAVSGTVTLELGVSQTPMVVAYRAHPLTARIVRALLSTKYVSLVNILQQKNCVPECLQKQCTPKVLTEKMWNILENGQDLPCLEKHLSSSTPPSKKISHILTK